MTRARHESHHNRSGPILCYNMTTRITTTGCCCLILNNSPSMDPRSPRLLARAVPRRLSPDGSKCRGLQTTTPFSTIPCVSSSTAYKIGRPVAVQRKKHNQSNIQTKNIFLTQAPSESPDKNKNGQKAPAPKQGRKEGSNKQQGRKEVTSNKQQANKEGRKQLTGGAVGKDGDVDALEKLRDVRFCRSLVNLRLPSLRREHSVERVFVGGSLKNKTTATAAATAKSAVVYSRLTESRRARVRGEGCTNGARIRRRHCAQ